MSTTETQASLFEEKKLDTPALKKFAQAARTQLLGVVAAKLKRVLAKDSLARRESEKAVEELEAQIEESSREQVIERVAYTWFNRFCALRFMDVNRYTKLGTVSPAEGFSQPEILADAKQGVIDDDWNVDKSRVLGLLDGSLPSDDPQQEAYQLLIIGVCNNLNAVMPKMFQKIADYTELLIPDDLLSDSSILADTRKALTQDNCKDVEVIGWLYQFYISEKKDEVINRRGVVSKDEIPAATQLFTPHWIVRYLVENSLGRLWMLNHPDSRLIEQMDYYIRPEEPETGFLPIRRPEEINICDPACGSGHMLTYAFDLLFSIYEEQGYQSTEIPNLILENNLYGIEIDQRAGALAAFALTMKARKKYRRFLQSGKVVQPNICVLENIQIDPEDLSAYMDVVGTDLLNDGLKGIVNQWEEADNFGSLIRPLVTDVSEVLELLRERQRGEDLFLEGVHQKVHTALRQADYLSPKYHVVVANPPYMGGKAVNPQLKKFLRAEYSEGKSDVFAAFVIRCLSMCKNNGLVAFVTPFVWMFLSSYHEFRDLVLSRSRITSLIQLEYNAFAPACIPVCTFVLSNSPDPTKVGQFIRLSDFRGVDQQPIRTLEAIERSDCGWFHNARTQDFINIPGMPIAYWISDKLRNVFDSQMFLRDAARLKHGISTGNNDLFVRHWHEVAFNEFSVPTSFCVGSTKRWFPFNKGGKFRKWYGNNLLVLNYKNGGEDMIAANEAGETPGFRHDGRRYYFREGITWSSVSSAGLSARRFETGFVFADTGQCLFTTGSRNELSLCALLNSKVTESILKVLSPGLHFHSGYLETIPLRDIQVPDQLVDDAVSISKQDWDAFEYSWDFGTDKLLRESSSESLEVRFQEFLVSSKAAVEKLLLAEEELNRLFIEGFGLSSELEPRTAVSDITLQFNAYHRYDSEMSNSVLEALLLADTMREFISYSVGCMLGRYSLDKPGLILANQGETSDDYRQQIPDPTFAPDEDNVIPLLDGDWFEDDITERFKEFLKVTFGTEHYEENLTFLENALYPDNLTGKKRKTIRDYFLKEFYNHHIKLYKKRPIYWLFSSPKGTFNALIYMHRYRDDTVSIILNDYLRNFQTKLSSKADHLQTVADSGDSSKAEKAKAIKEINGLKKQLKELVDYERDVLYPLATQQIKINLDDGVKVNYNKFGTALKKVTGLTGK